VLINLLIATNVVFPVARAGICGIAQRAPGGARQGANRRMQSGEPNKKTSLADNMISRGQSTSIAWASALIASSTLLVGRFVSFFFAPVINRGKGGDKTGGNFIRARKTFSWGSGRGRNKHLQTEKISLAISKK